MRRRLALTTSLIFALAFGLASRLGQSPRFILVGDSTMADYPPSRSPLSGWGQALRESIRGKATIVNKAVPGSSTLSFSRYYWKSALAKIRSGDCVLIQFGHNDKSLDPKRQTDPVYFRQLLRGFVLDSRKAGAIPVLLTPIPRYQFFNGYVIDTHIPYSDSMRSLAKEMRIPLIDVAKLGASAMERLGEYEVRSWYMLDVDGRDNVHLTKLGANNVAIIIRGELIRLGLL